MAELISTRNAKEKVAMRWFIKNIETLKKWHSISNTKDLYIALSLYKSGEIDKYALEGEKEWIDNSDIIKKQIMQTPILIAILR